jgi:hypothetical protein
VLLAKLNFNTNINNCNTNKLNTFSKTIITKVNYLKYYSIFLFTALGRNLNTHTHTHTCMHLYITNNF